MPEETKIVIIAVVSHYTLFGSGSAGLGLRNLERIYKHLVDTWILYDNSGSVPRLVDWGEKI